jgi:hypothetical protein
MKKRHVGFKVLYVSYALIVSLVVWIKINNHLNPDNMFHWDELPLVSFFMQKGETIDDFFQTDYSTRDSKALEIPLSVDLMKDMLSHMHPKASPFARLAYHGLYIIDEQGYLVRAVDESSLDLPVITGSTYQIDVKKWRFAGDDMSDALEFLKRIQRTHPLLYAQISELYISTDNGIIVQTSLAQGMPLILGKGGMERKARYLTAFVDRMEDTSLLDNIRYMDFRIEGQIILKRNG